MSAKRADPLAALVQRAGSDIGPIKRGGGLTSLIGGQQSEQAPVASEQQGERAVSAPTAPTPPPATRSTVPPSADDAAVEVPPTPGRERAKRTQRDHTRSQRTRVTVAAGAADGALRKNKTFSLHAELVRQVGIARATQGVFEYVVVEAALNSFFRKQSPGGPSPLQRRGERQDTTPATRKNKTLTLLPDIVRQVAIAAASWDVFEYEIVEAALEQHLRRISTLSAE